MRRVACISLFLLAISGCVTEPVTQGRVPYKEKLRGEDCDIGLALYRQRLELPPHAGVVVTGRPVPPMPPEEQERLATEFAAACHYSMMNRVQRAITRCWTDSNDAVSFRKCNDRF